VSVIHQRESHDLIFLFPFGLLCSFFIFHMSNFFQAKESRVVVLILFLVVRYDELVKKFASIVNLASLDQVDEMALEIVEGV
jgi:hypothetical protein